MKSSVALVLALAIPLSSGCKLLKKRGAEGDGTSSGEETSGEAPSKAKPKSGCALPEGGRVTSALTLTKGCTLKVTENIAIDEGGTLTIEAGAKLEMATHTYISVDKGKLVVRGTEKEPVVLTSANATKAPGDWTGIFLGEGISAGTEITNARIEYAGAKEHLGAGALSIAGQKAPKRISIVGTTFDKNLQAAIHVDDGEPPFAKLEKNVMKGSTRSLSAPPSALGGVGAGNTFADPLETWGKLTESATWPAFGAPVFVKEHLDVGKDGAEVVLTLAPGSVLKLAPSTYISVGEHSAASLVAPGVKFTSASPSPQAGDWPGLFFYKKTKAVNLEGATIEYAGQNEHHANAAVTYYDANGKEIRGLKANGLVIKDCLQAGMSTTDHDCGPYAAQLKVSGVPACRKE